MADAPNQRYRANEPHRDAGDRGRSQFDRGGRSNGDRLARVYAERNSLAVAFVRMANAAGWQAGRAIDHDPYKKLSDDWRHMLCVQLPGGELLQWHVAPNFVPMLEGLPEYTGPLDGQPIARHINWPDLLPANLCVQQSATFRAPAAPKAPATAPGPGVAMTPAQAEEYARTRVKASYWGPRAYRIEECATFNAALNWLIRNRHTVARDARIDEPGQEVRHYTRASLNELALKMEGRSTGDKQPARSEPVAAPRPSPQQAVPPQPPTPPAPVAAAEKPAVALPPSLQRAMRAADLVKRDRSGQ